MKKIFSVILLFGFMLFAFFICFSSAPVQAATVKLIKLLQSWGKYGQ